MSTPYQGNPANGAWTPAITVTEPSDGDTANVASVTVDMSKVADYMAENSCKY